MTGLTCADSTVVDHLLEGYDAYLGYIDGELPTASKLRLRYPDKHLIILTVLGGKAIADGCDRETGDLTPESAAAWADYRGWSPHVALGGWLAIHDVFPDPADGGRPPYELYCAALDSGEFVEDGECGSLRVLRRVAPPN